MIRPVAPRKKLAILCLVMFLGLLRAERGVAELQGRAGEPSRLLYVSTDRHGTWQVSVLGIARQFRTGVVLIDQDRPLLTLPAHLEPPGAIPWPEVDWPSLAGLAFDTLRMWLNQIKEAAQRWAALLIASFGLRRSPGWEQGPGRFAGFS